MTAAPRESMLDLIAELRRIIGDRGAAPHFGELELQSALDRHRFEVNAEPVEAMRDDRASSTFTRYAHAWGAWEGDAVVKLADATTVALDPAKTNLVNGVFVAATAQPYVVLYLTGHSFDLYASAAEVLEQWAAELARSFTFSADGASYNRREQHAMLLESAQAARSRARVFSVDATRSDVVTGYGRLSDDADAWGSWSR